MKKCVSTLFAALVLMNVMGYYALLVGLQHRNAESFTRQLKEGNYALEKTQSLKVYQPGFAESPEYSEVEGEFVKDGEVFRLIKQRHYRDTFHIVFIKDERGTLIRHAISDYARSFSDKSEDDSNQLIILPIFIREYLTAPLAIPVNVEGIVQARGAVAPKTFISTYSPTIIHPPQIV